MANELPKYQDVKSGTIYYLDLRLGEFRNVDNPHDRMPIITHRLMKRLTKNRKPPLDHRKLRLENYIGR
jgi:hypothetical protein